MDRSAVEPLELVTDDDDIIVTMAGICGNDYAVRKKIDSLTFSSHTIKNPKLTIIVINGGTNSGCRLR